jgi:hypothetical protein
MDWESSFGMPVKKAAANDMRGRSVHRIDPQRNSGPKVDGLRWRDDTHGKEKMERVNWATEDGNSAVHQWRVV